DNRGSSNVGRRRTLVVARVLSQTWFVHKPQTSSNVDDVRRASSSTDEHATSDVRRIADEMSAYRTQRFATVEDHEPAIWCECCWWRGPCLFHVKHSQTATTSSRAAVRSSSSFFDLTTRRTTRSSTVWLGQLRDIESRS